MSLPTDIQLGRQVVKCRKCASRFRVDRFVPYTDASRIRFCVVCGAEDLLFGVAIDTTLWGEIAEQFGIDVSLVKKMYEIWSPADGDPTRFIDYVRELYDAA